MLKKIMSVCLSGAITVSLLCVPAAAKTVILAEDDFSYLNIGDKWSYEKDGSTAKIGDNITLSMSEGDSVEYAYDETAGKNGLMLRKNKKKTGTLDFKYIFSKDYVGGKYRIEVDERIQNWSCAHPRWMRLLTSDESEMGVFGYPIAGGLWTNWSGQNITDRYGNTRSSWIGAHLSKNVYTIVNEFTAGVGNRVGIKKDNGTIDWGVEPALTQDTLTGVTMRIQSGGTNWKNNYFAGSDVDEDTVNNPDNDDISWIYSIRVEGDTLNVKNVSIQDKAENIQPKTPLEIAFDEELDEESITDANFILTKDGKKAEYTLKHTSGNTVLAEVEGGFDYAAKYLLEITTGVKSKSGLNLASEYAVEFSTVSLINTDLENGKRYTEGYTPTFTENEEISYIYEIAEGDGEFGEYDKSALNGIGEWRIKITARDSDGKVQEEVFEISIIGAVAPIAENVKISGEPIYGSTLTGEYVFVDENGDSEGESRYSWYRADEKDGTYEKIDGAENKEYTLSEDDEDKYIKFGVVPVSMEEPYEGEEVRSAAFVGAMNPKAENVAIEGKIGEGEELSVKYEYSDENGDTEIKDGDAKTVITWYSADKADGEFKKIGEGEKYTLTEKENEHWIRVGVIPKNAGSGKQDKEFLSESICGPFAPVAEDVKMIGILKAGSVVGVSYKYSDNNADSEGESEIRWYVDGKLRAEGASFEIEQRDRGSSIYVEVTPVSTVKPYKGKAAASDKGTIAGGGSSSVSSGGRNTGGSGGGVPVIEPIAKDNKDDKDDDKPTTKIGFSDIKGHWAEKEIAQMAEKGIVNGKAEDIFAPDDKITRAEIAAIITRAFDLSGGENVFSDVDDGAWYKDAAAAVYKSGFMSGSEGKFRPNDHITRQELAVLLTNIAKAKNIEPKAVDTAFEDEAEIADWAKESVGYAAACGLINGVSGNRFAPKNEATRAQAAVILSRIISLANI